MGLIICEYCGSQIDEHAALCPHCLGQVTPPDKPVETAFSGQGDHEVVLVNQGTCQSVVCNNMLEQFLGYSDEDADKLMRQTPVKIALGMNEEQAVTLASAMAEKGCQMAVYNREGQVDFAKKAKASMFKVNGEMVETAAAIIGTIGQINRVTHAVPYYGYGAPSFGTRLATKAVSGGVKAMTGSATAGAVAGAIVGAAPAAAAIASALLGDDHRSHQYDRGGAMAGAGGFGKAGARALAKGIAHGVLGTKKKKKSGLFGKKGLF